MFRRPPPLGKPNPLLRLAATDANSSRNQQVFRVSLSADRRCLAPRQGGMGGKNEVVGVRTRAAAHAAVESTR